MNSNFTAEAGFFSGGKLSGKGIKYKDGLVEEQGWYHRNKTTGEPYLMKKETVSDLRFNVDQEVIGK